MQTLRPTFLLSALVAVLVLASCAPRVPGMANPPQLDPADYRARGIPAQFGDTDPYDWSSKSPDAYAIHGIDAARYDGAINWPRAKAGGVRFAWLKATEGGSHLDPGWAVNAEGARAAGVPVGAYHFYYFCTSAEDQARWFIQNVEKRAGDLPPVLDLEWNHTSPTCRHKPAPAEVRRLVQTFTRIVTAHYGTPPVVYVAPDFYEDNDLGQLAGIEFWLRSVADHPSDRYPGERWSFWQYSGTGVVAGVKGETDLNAFAGGEEAWANWLAARAQR